LVGLREWFWNFGPIPISGTGEARKLKFGGGWSMVMYWPAKNDKLP